MLTIPIQTVPAQIVKVVLGGQNCQLNIYQKPEGVFVDVNSNGQDIVIGVIALDIVPIICREYLGFEGNLIFVDNRGNLDPNYLGFNGRFQLVYLTADEYVNFVH